jgi:hypothetical protein
LLRTFLVEFDCFVIFLYDVLLSLQPLAILYFDLFLSGILGDFVPDLIKLFEYDLDLEFEDIVFSWMNFPLFSAPLSYKLTILGGILINLLDLSVCPNVSTVLLP